MDNSMSLENARHIAEKELQCDEKRVILHIYETDEKYVFTSGIPGLPSYGGKNMISIDKIDGKIEPIVLPSQAGFKVLDELKNAKVVYDYENHKESNVIIEKCMCGENLKITWNDGDQFKAVRCPNCNNEMKFKNPKYIEKGHIRETRLDENGNEYEIEKSIDIPNIKEDAQKANLELIALIRECAGNDPFWVKSIENFFEKLNKAENEKIMFLKYLITHKELLNEFTREITGEYNANELFGKYNKSCPNCGEKLSFLMPDGTHLICNKCGKSYINNNGKVGEETSIPVKGPNVFY